MGYWVKQLVSITRVGGAFFQSGGLPVIVVILQLLPFCSREGRLATGACPCQDARLCVPILGTRDFEVFVFVVDEKTWKSYDWSQITTVAIFGKYDPELLCYAHSKGSRVVKKGDISLDKIIDPAVRASWIRQNIDQAKKQYMDGINIDIEQKVNKKSLEYYALTALVKETTEVFHKEIPGSQVTFDVSWSPKCIDYRCYNYGAIANSSDFLFMMSYDEQTQRWPQCIASANAPYRQTISGYDNYIRMGISPKKLVMGVPWYGYDYTCVSLSKAHICSLTKNVFNSLPCPKSPAFQVPYRTIMNQENSSLSGILWNEDYKAPYLEYQDSNGIFHQVWFDNPKSISLKAAYVKEHGLRGIGTWHADCLDYSEDYLPQEQTEAMWKALQPN